MFIAELCGCSCQYCVYVRVHIYIYICRYRFVLKNRVRFVAFKIELYVLNCYDKALVCMCV